MKLHNKPVLFAALESVALRAFKHLSAFQAQKLHLTLALSILFAVPVLALAQPASTRSISFPTPIQWTKQKGVVKYRLQIASDENFRSIFFDGRVSGERYTASRVPPGYYYWRTAPSDLRTGQFSKPVRFFISGGAVISGTLPEKATRRARVRNPVSNSH